MKKTSSKRFDDLTNDSFRDELLKDPLFKLCPELITPSFNFLSEVFQFQIFNDGEETGYASWKIKNVFSNVVRDIINKFDGNSKYHSPLLPYIWGKSDKFSYTDVVDRLVKIKLLNRKKDDERGTYVKKGKCRTYSIPPKCQALIGCCLFDYFKRLHEDHETKRKLQQKLSKQRNSIRISYNDEFLMKIQDVIINLDFDYPTVLDKLTKDFEKYEKEDEEKKRKICTANFRLNSILYCLIAFRKKEFRGLTYGKKNKRVWNLFVSMKKEYRKFMTLGDFRYVSVIDQRASHPSLLGCYCRRLIAQKSKYLKGINQVDLLVEIDRYNQFLNNTEPDPRKEISRDEKIDENLIKPALNRWINGGKWIELEEWDADGKQKNDKRTIPTVSKWIKSKFPLMHKLTKEIIPKKTVGTTLTKEFETKIFQDIELYRLGEKLGLKIIYEFDGVGIFAKVGDADLPSKIEQLKQHIQNRSKELLGFPIFLTVKAPDAT